MRAIPEPRPFEGFRVNSANRFAYAVAVAVAEAPGEAYNPVVMWGPSGAGKTHLLHAIRETIVAARSLDVRVLSGTTFVEALSSERSSLADLDVLLVDDLAPDQFGMAREMLVALAGRDRQVVVAVPGDYCSVREIYAWARGVEDKCLVVDVERYDAALIEVPTRWLDRLPVRTR